MCIEESILRNGIFKVAVVAVVDVAVVTFEAKRQNS